VISKYISTELGMVIEIGTVMSYPIDYAFFCWIITYSV
jgi:hypothetical protein